MASSSQHKFRRVHLLSSAFASLTIAAPPAYAADDPVEAGGDIIVTAQKRDQRLIDVPSAVSVLSPEALREAGVKDLVDASRLTPGVVVSPQIAGGRTIQTFTIRGIGYDDFRPNGNPSAAVSVDGVYQGSAALVGGQMFDVSRIEILKGPQGTLYGQTTTAGAVNIISNQPGNTLQGNARVEYGRFNSWRAEAAIGGPLLDGVKLRLAGVYDKTDGFITNTGTAGRSGSAVPALPPLTDPGIDHKAGRSKYYGGRAILVLEPNSGTRITLNAHAFREVGAVQYLERTATLGGIEPNAPYTVDSALPPELRKSSYGGSFTLNQTIADDVLLVAILGYEHLKQHYTSNGDMSPLRRNDATWDDRVAQGTAELRLQNASPGPIDWVLGANIYRDNVRLESELDVADALRTIIGADYTQRRRSLAGFADGSIKLGHGWKIGAGARYTRDRTQFRGSTIDLDPYGVSLAPVAFPPLPLIFARKFSDSSVSGRLNLSYEVSPSTTAYASISKGFKSGGFDGSTSLTLAETDPFQSERVWTYEAGVKFLPRGGPVQIETSVFYNDFSNLQGSLNKLVGGLPTNIRTNVGSARTFGAEANITVRPFDGLEIQSGVSLLESRILEMDSDDPAERERRIGNALPFAPKLTLTGAVRYTFQAGENFTITPSINGRFIDNYFTELDNYQDVKGYFLGNAQLEGKFSDHLTVTGWVRNFTNKRYATTLYVAPPVYAAFRGAPRTYGVSLGYTF